MKTFNLKICLIAVPFFLISIISADAGMFKKCDFMPERAMPNWMEPGFDKPGFYIGLGQSGEHETEEEQREVSVQNALNNLSRNISVKVISILKKELKSSQGYEEKTKKNIELITETSTKELLRDVNTRQQWLNREDCMLWTFAFVSKESVQEIKREIVMKNKFKTMLELYDKGAGTQKSPDINAQLQYTMDALVILDEIELKYLPDARSYDYYRVKFERDIERIRKEIEFVQGRIFISVLQRSGNLSETLVGRILAYIESGYKKAVRKPGGCNELKECLSDAREQGFNRLAMVATTEQVETRSLGTLRGTLTIELTIFDVLSKRIIRGPVNSSAQIIGWTEEDLDWDIAVDKIIKNDKLSFTNEPG